MIKNYIHLLTLSLCFIIVLFFYTTLLQAAHHTTYSSLLTATIAQTISVRTAAIAENQKPILLKDDNQLKNRSK